MVLFAMLENVSPDPKTAAHLPQEANTCTKPWET